MVRHDGEGVKEYVGFVNGVLEIGKEPSGYLTNTLSSVEVRPLA